MPLAQLILDGVEKMGGQNLGGKSLSPITKGLKGQKRSVFSLVSNLGRDQRTMFYKDSKHSGRVAHWGELRAGQPAGKSDSQR